MASIINGSSCRRRRRASKLIFSAIPFSCLLLLLFFLFSSSSSSIRKPFSTTTNPHLHLHHHSHFETINTAKAHCHGTLYQDLCVSSLSSIPNLASKTIPQIISSLINRTTSEVYDSSRNCSNFLRRRHLDLRQQVALTDCLELFDDTIDAFRTVLSDLRINASSHKDDIESFLSSAIANQFTCLDGFSHVLDGSLRPKIERKLRHISHLVSNSLAMVRRISKRKKRREALEGYGRIVRGFPEWIKSGDRKLLQSAGNTTNANIVVAKDGTGNFTTIGDAIAAAPNKSKTRFIIYIKAGAYFENVEVNKSKTNLMFIGDGIGKTVIKANRSVAQNFTTFRSATLAVSGAGFLAKGITVENSAGYENHQAVAMRSSSDLSAFYLCSFVGYQDTLYVHSLRQFYRECDIYGTVDFIFGDASVIFEFCNLYARKPGPKQKNIFTAQAREDPNENTGIVLHKCKIAAAEDLIPVQSSVLSYLGRPWREYSRTVIIRSNIGSLIDPAGWLEWNGTFALSTLYYAECENRGPGSNTTDRVKWPGYRVINSTEASQFSVANFIKGGEWLGITTFPFMLGL
ncbi:pectinesterase-like [Dioscorea cayenensis subsp. rotundata]|uniref:Pectinesterase n=1 Tax=Dioscorea cayennensis subsp. rotundata TaxID=55577 RepID=A0AB40AJ70_DIOCR|nr:pectinesterase-like [Dioscorea cayenensis subsp. rotundata]